MVIFHTPQPFEPWNKGKLVGQKAPLKLKDIWAIRIRLQPGHKIRDLALFNLAIDSKLRACDLVELRVSDVSHGGQPDSNPRNRVATKDGATCPVRDHPIDSRGRPGLDRLYRPQGLRFPVPQPRRGIAPPVDEAVRPDRPSLGGRCRPRVGLLRHAHDAQDQSFVDLPTPAKPSGRSALAWAHEAGEHRSLSGHRRGGRLGDRRAD